MTTFDCERFVAQAVRSVLAQTLRDFELIVVDDGSTDGTLEAVRAIRDGRVRILQVPRCGRIAALNVGFRAARAPYVANLDADDVCLPDRLAASVEALEAHPHWSMVGAAWVPFIDEEGREVGMRVRPTDPAEMRRLLGRSMAFFHSSCTYRRAAWEEAGGFDERLPMLEDYDLWVRLLRRWQLANLPRALAQKRRHRGQAFDARHWTNRGYRTRARIMGRYLRWVRPDPRVALRALAYLAMNGPLRLAWLRATGRDRLELLVRKQIETPGPPSPGPGGTK